MTEYVIEFHHTCDDRVVGWATCGVCGFKASLIDDTQDDVDRFLTDEAITKVEHTRAVVRPLMPS